MQLDQQQKKQVWGLGKTGYVRFKRTFPFTSGENRAPIWNNLANVKFQGRQNLAAALKILIN